MSTQMRTMTLVPHEPRSLAPYGVFRQILNHVTVTVTVVVFWGAPASGCCRFAAGKGVEWRAALVTVESSQLC
jgi:hypothetical protein